MPFMRVGEILSTKRFGLPQKRMVDAIAVVAAWEQIIEVVNCVEKFSRTRALTYRNGTLTIQAASSTVAAELKMSEPKIIAAYERTFHQPVVKRLALKRN